MSNQVAYLLSLPSIRDGAQAVFDAAKQDTLTNFTFHPERLPDTAEFVASLIKRDFGPDRFTTIPPHGRWQHFQTGSRDRLGPLLARWEQDGCDAAECTRRLLDLFFVSVLLDAGAGDFWKFTEPVTGLGIERSEGLAVASLYMFTDGAFSSERAGNPTLVDGKGLLALDAATVARGMQSTAENPLAGADGRAKILNELGKSLLQNPEIFGKSGRPGDLVDFMASSASSANPPTLDVAVLWSTLQRLLIPIWPSGRTKVDGVPIGDAWPLSTLERRKTGSNNTTSSSHIQPFHKLTQWLAYSLMVPFERLLGYDWTNRQLLTGLPEYRNGGLFVDMKVLSLKRQALEAGLRNSGVDLPMFNAEDDVIVEWRALTVALLDVMHDLVNKSLAASSGGKVSPLSLAQILEAGTWKAGRELAAKYRPASKSSPILVKSDGTLF